MKPTIDLIVDLQFGSTGKGLIAGYLAETEKYDTVMNANMPNAGHTYINAHGRKWVHKVLPNGIVSPNLERIMIGPGSIFSEDQLLKELMESIDITGGTDIQIFIHENAVVLRSDHALQERKGLTGISSTMQGSAAAMIEKIWRQAENNPCVGANKLKKELTDWPNLSIINSIQWNDIIAMEAENILLEGAQGYSLGINAGFYPFCTSRDCSPSRFLSDCQVPHNKVRRVIGTARIHPIRVGSLPGSTSGGYYPDQVELSWEDINQPAELTTVTGRERRIFSFSNMQIEEATIVCQPTDVFLNFCNYAENNSHVEVIDAIQKSLDDLGPENSRVTWTGWGPSKNDVAILI